MKSFKQFLTESDIRFYIAKSSMDRKTPEEILKSDYGFNGVALIRMKHNGNTKYFYIAYDKANTLLPSKGNHIEITFDTKSGHRNYLFADYYIENHDAKTGQKLPVYVLV